MKRGFMALLIICLAMIVAMVACTGGNSPYGCSACGLGCAACTACTACTAAGCALSCARGLVDTAQNYSTGTVSDYH